MTRSTALRIALAAALALAGFACRKEGPAERAGQKMDEAIERLRNGDEGAAEKTGRKLDEALHDAGERVDAALDDADAKLKDARDKAARAVEGD